MAELMPVADALARVLDGAVALQEERVALPKADGRVLTRDLIATRTQPPAPVSAMDGYAVRAADLPGSLVVIGESAAGHPFAGKVGAGETVRIFTGAVLPEGADSVLMQEDARREGATVITAVAPSPGRHVRTAGLDFAKGIVGLERGTRLDPRSIALAAAMNHAELPVHRRPRVALFSTGDELVAPGQDPGPDGIVSSNATMIAAVLAREGCDVVDLGIVADRFEDTQAMVRDVRNEAFDVLVTSGGASVGDHDMIHRVLTAEGVELGFWKIAMRPGKPLMMGRLGGLRILGLPGNPVSSYVCTRLFVVPLVRALSGRRDVEVRTETAFLGSDLPKNDQRADYLRATLSLEAGRLIATAHPIQDSSMIRVLAQSQALILRAPHASAAVAGDACEIIRLE
ncbi:MAG: gephyrin-like molybdotransferase Glp [Alphaproteobacteria bacterium]|jgi:molybdopterin molybdotransferase